MLGKLADRNQCEIFRTRLADLINPQHELALLADKIRENFHRQNKYYSFTKIIIDNSVINNSKKGIEFFIRTYFDEEGIIKPRFIKDSSHFLTIVKVLFDAGIRIGECDVGFFIEGNTAGFSADRIQDLRFYIFGNEIDEVKFVIPPEYRDSK